MDNKMTLKWLFKKIIFVGLLPSIPIGIAMMILGRETVNRVMVYTLPLAILPLIKKILKKRSEPKKSNTTS
jgi:hypothetical protein